MGIEGFESLEERITPATAYPAIDISSPPSNTIDEVAPPELDGKSVISIEDVNGDGKRDWFLTEGLAGPEEEVFAFVVFGNGSGNLPNIDLTTLDGTKGFQIATNRNQIVTSSVTTGDVNGDGLNDLIFVANHFDPTTSTPEDPEDFTTLENVCIVMGDTAGHEGFVNVADADGISSASIGYIDDVTVNVVGDINHDGSDELVLAFDVRYIFGSDLPPSSAIMIFGSSDSSVPYTVNEYTTLAISPDIRNEYLASISVTGAGDFDGDGIEDILVTSLLLRFGTGQTETMVNVVYGHEGPFDLNIYFGEFSTNNSALLYRSQLSNSSLGTVNAVSIGDFNGDGRADVVIAERDPLAASNRLGHIILGSDIRGNGGIFDPSSIVRLSGELASGFVSIASVGDYNGDGLDDFLIRTIGEHDDTIHLVTGTQAVHSNIRVDGLKGIGGFGITDSAGAIWASKGWGDLNGDGLDDIIIRAMKDTGEDIRYVVYGQADVATPQVAIKDPRTATYTDENGHLVTIKISKGHLAQENFLMSTAGSGIHLDLLKLDDPQFAGAVIKITTSDGLADVTNIFAGDVDLKSVAIQGHLGSIVVGDQDAKRPGLKMLKVASLGGDRAESLFHGGAAKLRVDGSIESAVLHAIEGSFGSVKVADRLVDSVINVTRDVRPESTATGIGSLSIGSNVESSRIVTDGGLKIKSVKVGGDWIASDLAAGTMPGDEFYGNENDYAIDGLTRGSVIGKLLIQGVIAGTAASGDSFGICAGEIGRLQIAGQKLEVFRNSPLPAATNDVSLRVFS